MIGQHLSVGASMPCSPEAPSQAAETGPWADNLNAVGSDAVVAQDDLGGVSNGGG